MTAFDLSTMQGVLNAISALVDTTDIKAMFAEVLEAKAASHLLYIAQEDNLADYHKADGRLDREAGLNAWGACSTLEQIRTMMLGWVVNKQEADRLKAAELETLLTTKFGA